LITVATESRWVFIYNNKIQKNLQFLKNHQQRQARFFGLTALCFV
jgi:hypothetical protein